MAGPPGAPFAACIEAALVGNGSMALYSQKDETGCVNESTLQVFGGASSVGGKLVDGCRRSERG
jgi:hypothetical protein